MAAAFILILCPPNSGQFFVGGKSQRGGGGGKTYRGGKRTIDCPLQNQFWRPQKVGFVWSVPVSCNFPLTGCEQAGGGGETYHRWGGGSKPVFWGRGFMVCLPFPSVFHPPLFFFKPAGLEILEYLCPSQIGPNAAPTCNHFKRVPQLLFHVFDLAGANAATVVCSRQKER